MDLASILGRVEARLKATGLSADKASAEAGKPDAIRNLRRAVKNGASQGPAPATLNALAPVLKTTSVWLLAGAGPEVPGEASPPTETSADEITTMRVARQTVRPLYGGIVQAGSFHEANDFDDDPERMIPAEEVDKDFPEVPIISFDVAGDSMNDLKPMPILPGQRVIGVEFEGLRNRVELRDGMVVVVEQTLGGGHLRERSVKQLKMHRDRTEFWPRSTNPKHKPIVVSYEMVDQGSDDGREVKIIAIVRRVVHDMPNW